MFFFFKQVRILPEIYCYNYQRIIVAPMVKVRHWIKTDPFLQSVTSEPTVGSGGGMAVTIEAKNFFMNSRICLNILTMPMPISV